MQEIQIISDYLYENHYIDSYDNSAHFISAMSDEWIDSILTERRGFRAVYNSETKKYEKVPHKKTPLYNLTPEGKRMTYGQIRAKEAADRGLTPRGPGKEVVKKDGKLVVQSKKQDPRENKISPQLNLSAYLGKARQGAFLVKGHEGGLNLDRRPQPHGTGGRLRGRKKVRGSKAATIEKIRGKWKVTRPQTPVSRFKKERENQQIERNYPSVGNKYFPARPIPKTSLDVLRQRKEARQKNKQN